MSFSKTLLGQSIATLGLLFLIIVTGLFIDSKFIADNFYEHAQWLNNLIVVFVFSLLYFKSTSRTKEMLLYALIIGVVGEYIFSVGFGMYTYRLKNIPHYVPFGHAIVFVLVYYFSRKPKVKKNRTKIEKLCVFLIIPISFYFLLFKNDVFGFICTLLVFLFLRKYPKERMFYLVMYCVVAVLEFVGTGLECWKWPTIAFNNFEFLPSANPPIGISLFYFGLDRGTMSIYKRRHKKAWNRLKNIRSVNS
ncbi:hypothetical protein WH52_11930 [Tenacibaculum holothuriorum]|uniref:Uncharacterized protein n=1 Tax=Tenacibaculum holothuriorum TaxID=1635173 RepID=A0A1Y2PB09_9FLAO|nr:hypothetical protein [Tenacibaculum holothuriorum]OSY87350.1 hypothetical protein WH52_11930 [Tenacibaculum holothuriorum]